MKKLKLCISSCLLGNRVRYDGEDKLDMALLSAFGDRVEWIAVCPEVECGLPVPREPIRLVRCGADVRLLGVTSRIDHTGRMLDFCRRRIGGLMAEMPDGFILKRRSPSCALADVGLFDGDGNRVGSVAGVFAAALTAAFPHLPVAEAESLRDPAAMRRFRELLSRRP